MNEKNANLSDKLAKEGARMTPIAFENRISEGYKLNGKRLETLAGGKEEARKIVAGFMYAASRVPQLMECSEASLWDCMLQSAQLQLYPGALQQCAYLPFRDNKKGCMVATFVPMYQGLVKLAFNTGLVKSIQADVVYERDEFSFEKGTNKHLKHVPFLGSDADRGAAIAVYCVVETTEGVHFEVKSTDWVLGIMKRSKAAAKGGSPWDTDIDEMAKKSVFKHAAKWIPKSPTLAEAIEIDNAVERPDIVIHPVMDITTKPAAPQPAAKHEAKPEPKQQPKAIEGNTGVKLEMPKQPEAEKVEAPQAQSADAFDALAQQEGN